MTRQTTGLRVEEAFSICNEAGLPIAIASSSSREMIESVLDKFGLADKVQLIHSAHDETHGKPHPTVYITTAKELGVHPNHCLALEDSVNGVLAAKAAKIKCIAVPEPHF